jgi:hypothetical protein
MHRRVFLLRIQPVQGEKGDEEKLQVGIDIEKRIRPTVFPGKTVKIVPFGRTT